MKNIGCFEMKKSKNLSKMHLFKKKNVKKCVKSKYT